MAALCTEHEIAQAQYHQWQDKFLSDAHRAFEVDKPERALERRPRQYLQKSCAFDMLTQAALDIYVAEINNRPRKVLGFRTPRQILFSTHPPRGEHFT